MKTCPACGLHVEEDYLYCWEDGMRLSGGETLVLPQRPTAPMATREHPPLVPDAAEGVDEQRVLSCQVCGGEFPLTFTACPVHDLPLTSERVRRNSVVAETSVIVEEPIAQVIVSDDAMLPSETVLESELWPADETLSREIEETPPSLAKGSWAAARWNKLRDHTRALWQRISNRQAAHRRGRSMDRGFALDPPVESQHSSPPPGMRLAARGTAIALGLFTVAGLYVFYRQVTRAPARSARASAVQSGAAQIAQIESPLIATPSEAREYRDEPAPPPEVSTAEEMPSQPLHKQTPSSTASNDAVPRTTMPAPSRPAPANTPSATSDSIPLPTSGRFNAQLVRVRSYKANSGYSYTLTFTLFEHAGRPMKWERLSIVTHSASGATHTEMLPFQHWLAGSGALTFTVNVDMVGASEADWRGRISCMSVGADETGRPLRASFGTNVAP